MLDVLKNINFKLQRRSSTNLIIFLAGLTIFVSSGVVVASLKSFRTKNENQIVSGITATPTPLPTPTPPASIIPTASPKPTQIPTTKPSAKPVVTTPQPTSTTTSSNINSSNNSSSTTQNTSPQGESPIITGMNASDANFGQYINYTIAGDRFGSTQGTITIYENNGNIIHNGMIYEWQNNSIKVNIVGGSGTGYSIMVTTYDGKQSNKFSFSQPLGQPYFTPDSISPKNAKPGEIVTISGDRFDSGNGKVTFDGAEGSITSWSNSEIKVTIPNSLSPGKEVAMQIISSKGQQSSIHYYTLGN